MNSGDFGNQPVLEAFRKDLGIQGEHPNFPWELLESEVRFEMARVREACARRAKARYLELIPERDRKMADRWGTSEFFEEILRAIRSVGKDAAEKPPLPFWCSHIRYVAISGIDGRWRYNNGTGEERMLHPVDDRYWLICPRCAARRP